MASSTRTALEPLRALRYDQARVELAAVIAPPYDVIGGHEREALLRRSPYSVVRLILPDAPAEAGRLLAAWRREGVLRRDEEPLLWWHEQRFVGPDGVERTRGGAMGALRLSPYAEGRVRPHERTHAEARQGRLELLRATATNLSPIFALYDDPSDAAGRAAASATGRAPDMDVSDGDGTVHRFWALRDRELAASVQAAVDAREILIADGHHRYETALAYRDERRRGGAESAEEPYDFMLAYLANLRSPGLAIFPTHRVVLPPVELRPELLAPFALEELPAGTSARAAEAALARRPRDAVAFAVWRGEQAPALVASLRADGVAEEALPDVPEPVRRIDSALLEALVLGPLLGLRAEEFSSSRAVRYVRDLDAAAAMVDGGEASLAFLLRAPGVEQVREVAAAGGVMPQKSTYFFPKLYCGFLLNPLDG